MKIFDRYRGLWQIEDAFTSEISRLFSCPSIRSQTPTSSFVTSSWELFRAWSAFIGHFFPHIYGVGYETISDVLQQNTTFSLMLALVFLKIIAMSLTLAGGGSGGVFAPSLFVGAMLGGSFGYMVNVYFPNGSAPYGAYALVGMAALFSATGRATFTAIVILFEMTLDYSIILPLMFACVTADQVVWLLSRESIYSLKLKRKGLNFITDMSVNVMSITSIRDIMTTKLDTITLDLDAVYICDHLLTQQHTRYPVAGEREGNS